MDKNESSRLELFRQLKKEIRGSERHLIIGIDVAKEKHNAFFGTATGKSLSKRLVFENTIEGFRKLLTYSESVKVRGSLEKEVFGVPHSTPSSTVPLKDTIAQSRLTQPSIFHLA